MKNIADTNSVIVSGITKVVDLDIAVSRRDTGFGNTAYGFEALRDSDGNDGNTAVDIRALLSATTGDANVAIGGNADPFLFLGG